MAGFFYNLGRAAGGKLRKGRWVWASLAGDEADILRAEAEVGRDLAEAMKRELGIDPDASAQRRLSEIGGRLTLCVRNKLRRFEFTIVGGDEPNAFALPGGFVMVTRALTELVGEDADQVAFVLGHEMAHVIKQDPMGRIMTDAALGAAMRVAPLSGVAAGWLKSSGLRLLQSAYSQEAELVADALGARLAQAAGFDRAGGERLLARLQAISHPPERRMLGEYFSTHPEFGLRIGKLRAAVR